MTVQLALEYIPRRMRELGYCDRYLIRFRHLRLLPGEQRWMQAYNQLLILIEPPEGGVIIQSDGGYFDISDDNSTELQYEHQGELLVVNQSPVVTHVRFIQVIPKI
jgi:hypothetical protein